VTNDFVHVLPSLRQARRGALAAALVMNVFCLAGCGAEPSGRAEDGPTAETPMTFEQFKARTYREPDSGVYIVEGDMAIDDEARLRTYFDRSVGNSRLAILEAGLLDNLDVRWDDTEKLNLTYCVSKNFGNRYDQVVEALSDATAAWEGAADVRFVHLADHDDDCNKDDDDVVFDVRPVKSKPYLARSFFPDYPRSIRNILVDKSAFSSRIPLVGALRHELGHILGFVHEHIRAPDASGNCAGDEPYRGLTPYDSSSVMHYSQCGGTNGTAFTLSADDVLGVQEVYGAP
jgi:hypothetical protein